MTRLKMAIIPFEDEPPMGQAVTSYDERHFVTYIRLLDADEEGADWREAVQIIFDIDAAEDPTHAKKIHSSHLARAQWMTEAGYKHLLEK